MADVKKRQLAFNIIEFLRASCQDGTVKEDDKESLEVAISCIGESFGVDPDSSSEKSQFSLAPANLLSLLEVYLKTKAKSTPAPASTSTNAESGPSVKAEPTAPSGPSEADLSKAEALKVRGNSLMSQKQYESAISAYTSAIGISPNPVYYSNRAAAHGALGDHEKAADDAQASIDLDPKFVKGYSRLGHARFSMGEWEGAVQAYEEGLEIDPGNATMKASLTTARAKAKEEGGDSAVGANSARGAGGAADSNPLAGLAGLMGGAGGGGGGGGMPDLSALAGLMGGGGGAGRGGGGGMPDLASLMQNPQMMAMAQQMMAGGGLERMLQNPSVRRMAEQYQSGGGMPDMSELANNPEMQDLAQQFMGGGAGRGAGGR